MTALALPIGIGKLTILLGAGLVGSVLAKEGRVTPVTDLVTGACKVFFSLNKDDSSTSRPKSDNDNLLKQIEFIRKELESVLPDHSTVIVTSNRSGSKIYALIVVVVGCGYVWWKGWRVSDMMLATRGVLKDACASVAKQLEDVDYSIRTTKRKLSSELECVGHKVDECADNIAATRDEVSELHGEAKIISSKFRFFQNHIQDLETKINRMEEKQNNTNLGVVELVAFASSLQNGRIVEAIVGEGDASRPALEFPKAASLPSITSSEPPSPTSNECKQASFKPVSTSKSPAYTSGLKDLGGIFDDVIGPSSVSFPEVPSSSLSNLTEESPISSTSTSRFCSRVVARTFSRHDFVPRSRREVQPTTSGTVTPKPPVAS